MVFLGGVGRRARGAWEVQSVKYLTLDFSSGHDVMVREFKCHVGDSALTVRSLLGILSLSLYLSPAHTVSVSLKMNKLK